MADGLLENFDPETVGEIASPEPQQTKPDLLGQFDPEKVGVMPEPTSATGAFLHAAERSALPAAGGLVAAGAGAEIGAGLGALGGPAAPVTVPVGAIVGGLAGFMGGAAVVEKAQSWGLQQLPDSWKEAIGIDERQEQMELTAHPTAAFIGGLAPYALAMQPGKLTMRAAQNLPENATAFQRIIANPMTGRLFGAGLMGGMELGQELAAGQEHPDWTNVAIATGFGLIFNKPTRIGESLTGTGARAVRAMSGRAAAEPTVAEVGDAKVMGPGVTEEVFLGGHEQAPEAAMTAQDAARTETSLIGDLPEPDLHGVARRMEPELFDHYDALAKQRDELRSWIDELRSPGDDAVREVAAARDAAKEALDAHLEARGGYTGGAEARRLRAELRDAQRAYDTVEERRNAFTEGRAEETEEMAAARRHLMAVDYEMRDVGREVAAAYRRAAEHRGVEMVEPEIEADVSFAPQAEAPAAVDQVAPSVDQVAPEAAGRPLTEQRAFIADDVKRQLVAAGRSEEEARAAGQLIAARYVTRANLFKGALGTPEELYRREGAEIRGPGGAAPTPAGEPPVAAEAPARELVEATPQEPEPIFIGGKRVEGEFAAKLRDRIIEREAPEMVAAGPEDAGEPIFIGGQEIKGPLAAQIRARMAAEPRVEEAPAPLMPTVEKPEIAAPAPAERVSEGGGIEALDPTTIDVDAERFQFKAGGDTAGVTERLQGIEKWDPRLAGTALVWRDASGKNWIADGHQRLGLAKRLSETQPGIKLNAFVLDAKEGVTDSDARVIAAVKNIAEGSGTSIDAAKIMKEAEGKDIDLPPLPPRSTLVREGQALARLSPEAFGMVVNDVVPTGQAALVGKLVADPLQQVEALRVLAKAQPDNLRQAEMIVREILATGTEEKMTQGGLFGEEAFAESVVFERARIADEALKMLKRDKSTFRTLVNEAEGIQTYGRNVLDVAANVERLTADEQASQFLSQLATRKGPVSDELTAIARRLKSEEISRAEAGREFVKIVRREIEGGLVEGADARGADAGAAGERAPVEAELFQKDGEPRFEPGAEGKPQQLIPGVEPVTDRQRAELAATKPLKGGAAAPPEGGLFDEGARDQKELFQRGEPVVLKGEGDVGNVTTGTPVTFKFRHNTESATKIFGVPDKDAPYGRGYEPSGRYVTVAEPNEPIGKSGKMLVGTLTFQNPLVIENKNLTWKKTLSEQYGGKAGKELSAALIADGYDGVITTEKQHISEVLDLTTFDEAKALYQGARGKIRFAEKKRPIITLMRDANASTFIHETGHDWLEQLVRDSSHEMAPAALKDDATTVLDWLGAKSVDDIKTRHHEKFARGFEQYLREGVAPSKELAGVFAKFKNWLVQIYQTIKGLGAPINDDIRGVFDRMIAEEPSRTVVAPEREGGPSLIDIHETDAKLTEPHEAAAAADRIAAERARYVAEPPPEIENEIRPIVEEVESARAEAAAGEPGAEPGADAGGGAGGRGEVVGGREQPETVAKGGGVGARGGEERQGGTESEGEGGGLPREQRGADRLSPRPADLFGPKESQFLDRAGNIRVENLTTREDVAQAIHDSAEANNDFIGDRRGVVTDGQVLELADALGMTAESLSKRKIGQAFNAEQVVAARRLLIRSATNVAELMRKAATGTDEEVLAYAEARDRHQMIQAQVAGITAEAGRALRAFRDISRETGQGVQNVDQFLRTATGKTLFQLRQEAQLGLALETPEQVSKFMHDARGRSFGRMVLEYWINGLISGPKSQLTYSIGNTLLSLQNFGPETALAAGIAKARKLMGREGESVRIGEVAAAFRGAREGLAPAIKAAGGALRTGVSTVLPGEKAHLTPFETANVMAPRAELDEAYTFAQVMPDLFGAIRGMRDGIIAGAGLLKAGGVAGSPAVGPSYTLRGEIPNIAVRGVDVLPVGELARLPSRMNATLDSFFRAMNYSMGKSALAYRIAESEGLAGTALDARIAELRTNPTPQMMETARVQAGELSLLDKGGEFTQAVTRLTNTQVAGVPILKFVAPFVRVASNTIEQSILRRTPVGLFSEEIRADLSGKNGNVAQDKALARMLAGTALSITFGGLAAEGLVSGSGPKDPKESAVWRLAGNQAHSVRIGDFWYDVRGLGPLGMLVGVAADLYDAAHKAAAGEMEKAAAMLHHAFMQNILDQSFMKGPADLIKAVEDPDRFGQTYIRNFLSSFVPYSVAMGQIARSMDPYSRQARSIADAIKAKVPGLSEELRPRRDIWGEAVPNRESLLGVTTMYATKVNEDPVNRALLELGVFPGQPQRKIRNVELTDEQFDDYQRIAGRAAKMRLDAIVRAPQFQTWPNEVRHSLIEETVRQSREMARNAIMAKDRTIPLRAYQQKVEALRKGNKQ